MIDGLPAGLAFREGKDGENFGDMSPFLLHTVNRRDYKQQKFDFNQTQQMFDLRSAIYGHHKLSDPLSTYQKNSILPQINIVSSYEKDPSGYGSKSYTEWYSYKSFVPEIDTTTADWQLSQAEIDTLQQQKCAYEVVPAYLQTNTVSRRL